MADLCKSSSQVSYCPDPAGEDGNTASAMLRLRQLAGAGRSCRGALVRVPWDRRPYKVTDYTVAYPRAFRQSFRCYIPSGMALGIPVPTNPVPTSVN